MRYIHQTKAKNISQYVLLSMLIFFGSFKAPEMDALITYDAYLGYSVPNFIERIMSMNNLIVGLIIFTSILTYFALDKNILEVGSIEAKYFFSFYLILILTELVLNNDFQRFYLSIILLFSVYLYFNHVLNNLNFYLKNDFSIVKSIFFGGFIFLIFNFFIHFSGYGNLIYKGRFFGLTSHPNFFGLTSSIFIILSYYLFRNEDRNKLIYFSGLVLSCYMMLLSDSRTAIVSSSISLIYLITFNSKNKLFRTFVILSILLSIIFLIVFVDSIYIGERGNNRSGTWTILYQEAMKFPIFGSGRHSVGATTNSILYAVVAAGIFGGGLFILAIASKIKFCTSLVANKTGKIYTTLILLLLIMSIAEGFLIENIGVLVFTFWILISVKKVKFL